MNNTKTVAVAAQVIRTRWTKQSRGAPEATRRNAVPLGLPLLDVALPLLHEVTYDERTQFIPDQRLRHIEFDPHDVATQETNGLLRVLLTAAPHGMPRRWQRPPALRLAPGEWVRWRINYRFVGVSSGEWHYQQDTLNLAYGPVDPGVFIGSPTYEVNELAHLR